MKLTIKSGFSNPVAPFILIFALIILTTIIISNIRNARENSEKTKEKRTSVEQLKFNPFLNSNPLPPEEEASDETAPNPQYLAASALTDWSQGNFEAAEDKFRTILVFQPNNPIALSHLGALLHHRGDYKNAELMFRQQTLYFPSDPGAYMNLGAVLAKQNKWKEAIRVSKRSLELDPSSSATALNLAKIYAQANNKPLALEYFKRAAGILGRGIVEAAWDPVFDSIKELPEFKKMVQEASAGDGK